MTASTDSRVDLRCGKNNALHHTSEICDTELIVRRGQVFTLDLDLKKPFMSTPLDIYLSTGEKCSEELGTECKLSIPDGVTRSPKAKAVWKVEINRMSNERTGKLVLDVTPPADVPIGEWTMKATYQNEEIKIGELTVLFNPWCPQDSVFLDNEAERQEYVMNELGQIYVGSADYIMPLDWDYGQFEVLVLKACMKMLDCSHFHTENPDKDVPSRSDPVYVGRVVSAMVNSEDDCGILEGQWGGPYVGGKSPTHWSGSAPILIRWFKTNCQPVKYGQCWVFAGVMCSAMRLLGIPCRTVTNFTSAHDTNSNLIIERFHSEDGIANIDSGDSVWNFHVWVEGYMKRPDLSKDGSDDGWQVLDPTPQETSNGIYCCGPASKDSILKGNLENKYDAPFIYAEVNADCTSWMVKADLSIEKIETDAEKVGKFISTKAVGKNERQDITDTYKFTEGTYRERLGFLKATVTNFNLKSKNRLSAAAHEAKPESDTVTTLLNNLNENSTPEVTDGESIPPPPPVSIKFKEVTKPMNGQDVSLMLVLSSESTDPRPLSIKISVQALKYNGAVGETIQKETKNETLQPKKELSIPILVPFSKYCKPMLDNNTMKVSALVEDTVNPDHPYLGEDDVVLTLPPISVSVSGIPKVGNFIEAEISFENPVNETLKECNLTISGSGLWEEEVEVKIQDLKPSRIIRCKLSFCPYKAGKKTIMADFDCSLFRDVKGCCTFTVTKLLADKGRYGRLEVDKFSLRPSDTDDDVKYRDALLRNKFAEFPQPPPITFSFSYWVGDIYQSNRKKPNLHLCFHFDGLNGAQLLIVTPPSLTYML